MTSVGRLFLRQGLLLVALAFFLAFPAFAGEKEGMPDLSQIEQTCLPTATANLIIWFGKHGYPKLILPGATEEERYSHTVHQIMADTNALYEWGTRRDTVASGIEKYIRDAGYNCNVEYRGMDAKRNFTQDWLKENDEQNKGFILLLSYCAYHQDSDTFTDAWNAGHAVTLVNSEPDMLLIHDPAHEDDETGRKILTPEVLTKGSWGRGINRYPVSGLMLLSGSLLEGPPNSMVMLTGAVCVTMLPQETPGSTSPLTPGANVAGTGTGDGTTPGSTDSTPAAKPVSASTTWVLWLFNLIFGK